VKSPEGRVWGASDAAKDWFVNEAPQSFFDALGQHGFEEYFAGRMPEPPATWFTPETAPRIGSRVRFTRDEATMSGTRFRAGELAFVSELHLSAVGSVGVTLRTPDGRQQILLSDDGSFSPA